MQARIVVGRLVLLGLLVGLACSAAAAEPAPFDLWPAAAPGELGGLGPEADTTKPDDRLIAGRPVIRLGNVSRPQLTVYPAPDDRGAGAAVIVAPGGGYHILAYDLEGTEVCEWLNSLGVTAVLLKYRVPARAGQPRGLAALQDAQRAISLVRSRAAEWKIDPNRIGMLGFSAGGNLTALAATRFESRSYEPVDEVDRVSCRPDFGVLVYTAGLANDAKTALKDDVTIPADTPPFFLVHAADDRVAMEHSVLFFLALRRAETPAELHVYSHGGHGFGLRRTEDPVTTWPDRCAEWLRRQQILR